MEIQVNGDAREFPDGSTVAGVLEELGAARPGVAVALDGAVVPRGEWAGVTVRDGAQLEILVAVQGG
ncbi:sulfur carrier protein ThiS [Amycolatopsis nigrescens]|uniref:sulfur carrier protein ThiS n=1 Tax=Amycolatopsis nigrescens TaxID=381445 RepID=UPI000399FA5B|nr:sulfur carrier protein ThiS [Amycolatopsis nigrescens]